MKTIRYRLGERWMVIKTKRTDAVTPGKVYTLVEGKWGYPIVIKDDNDIERVPPLHEGWSNDAHATTWRRVEFSEYAKNIGTIIDI